MPSTIARRTYMQSKLKIDVQKTVTLAAGANTIKVVPLNAGIIYKTINFFIQDFDVTGGTTVLRVVATTVADGTGTEVEIYTSGAIAIANDQTLAWEIDMAYVSSVCQKLSGGITPLAIALKCNGATVSNTLALVTIAETDREFLGQTPSSILGL
jgi:hypothetical protein